MKNIFAKKEQEAHEVDDMIIKICEKAKESEMDASSDGFDKLVEAYVKLSDSKRKDNPKSIPVDNTTKLIAVISTVQLIGMVVYQERHVIMSGTTQWLMKLKSGRV